MRTMSTSPETYENALSEIVELADRFVELALAAVVPEGRVAVAVAHQGIRESVDAARRLTRRLDADT